MVASEVRQAALEKIRSNIAQYGLHIYVIQSSCDPRFAYSIGLSEILGFELILAGAIYYALDDVTKIFHHLSRHIRPESLPCSNFEIPSFGSFALGKVHSTWSSMLMLGALDYYQTRRVPALQILPNHEHWTIDTPDLSQQWSPSIEPAWRWLKEEWSLPIPKDSLVMTDLAALAGARITEAARWEEDYWELFSMAGPDVKDAQRRIVPISVLLAKDPSLEPVFGFPVGQAMWRENNSDWQDWAPTMT